MLNFGAGSPAGAGTLSYAATGEASGTSVLSGQAEVDKAMTAAARAFRTRRTALRPNATPRC
ncbi:hypothetical protein [Amycolatopsis sp. FDAARGOS 1241]|uniref:hypothetical protein n=1 Tax=Amycolatopsis sp. FDAARGOS 1241 TaxID=2778070 RepID=UPI001951748E|nr:hypothetical protein [Amycolatopsis sp. FDAARGOS 1241]QRP43906.1 hypothetical protein I6J71_31850 [Amycolatopsis sp. FDAARGOS 1241]